MNLHFGKRVVLLWRNDYGKGDECYVFCKRKEAHQWTLKKTYLEALFRLSHLKYHTQTYKEC